MSQESRWVRLNVDWETSTWLEDLQWAVRAVWPVFLCHVKLNGNNRGQCKSVSVKAFARMHDIPAEMVEEFFHAAKSHGALSEVDGTWDVTGWTDYQSPDAARMRKLRTEPNAPEPPVTVRNETPLSVTSADCSDSCHATMTETVTETETIPRLEVSTSIVTNHPAHAGKKPFNKLGFDRWFETKFKTAYPRRKGDFEWPEAKKKLEALFRAGKADPNVVLEGLARYSRSVDAEQKAGTPLVKQASTWVAKAGWEDEYGEGSPQDRTPAAAGSFAQDTADLTRRALEHFNAA